MSTEPTDLGPELFRYVAEHAPQEDAFLRELREEAVREGIPRIWIRPEQAALLQVLLRLGAAKEVVEVGTLAGYSAIWMARALPEGGRVRTLEIEPRFADFAERWIARSEVAGRVEVLRGDARELLPRLAGGSADAAFIDADKAGYAGYLEECLRIVRAGGLLAADNAFAFGQLLEERPEDPDVLHIRAFNDRMAAEDRVQAVIVPLGDGCWVGVRR